MVSTLEFRFDAHDAAGRAKARAKFLRTLIDRCRKVRQAFADQGSDDPFLDLMMLQSVWQHFIRYERGYPAPYYVRECRRDQYVFADSVSGNTDSLRLEHGKTNNRYLQNARRDREGVGT